MPSMAYALPVAVPIKRTITAIAPRKSSVRGSVGIEIPLFPAELPKAPHTVRASRIDAHSSTGLREAQKLHQRMVPDGGEFVNVLSGGLLEPRKEGSLPLAGDRLV